MATDLKFSAGARFERKAVRAYLRRILTKTQAPEVATALAWVLSRQSRYDKKAGGLGRT